MSEQEQKRILEEWLDRHRGLLFKVVRAYAHTHEDRDDLFQDIVLQVWRSIPNFRGDSAVTTWLYRIALNIAMKWNGRQRRHEHAHTSIQGMEGILKTPQDAPDERLLWLYREISKLNEVDRSLCLLLLDGISYKEMSGIVGISESNVGVRINRIKQKLIKRSEKHDFHGI